MSIQRFSNRIPRRLQLRYWRRNADPATGHVGYSKNISPTGLFVATNAPYNPGTELTIELHSDEEVVMVGGKVVHAARVAPLLQKVRSSGMGIQLSKATDAYLKLVGIEPEPDEKIHERSETGAYVRSFQDTAAVRRALAEEVQFGELSFRTGSPPSEGAPVHVEVRFPNSDIPYRGEGHVVAITPAEAGGSWVRVAITDTSGTVRWFKRALAEASGRAG